MGYRRHHSHRYARKPGNFVQVAQLLSHDRWRSHEAKQGNLVNYE
jgi:hypothetical protein